MKRMPRPGSLIGRVTFRSREAAPDDRPEVPFRQPVDGQERLTGEGESAAQDEVPELQANHHPGDDRPARRLAQAAALAVGLLLVVLGGIVVARTGIHVHRLATRARVAGLEASTLWGLVELGIGVILVTAGLRPAMVRGPTVFFGVALLAFGVIVIVEPMSFRDPLNVTTRTGALDLALGAVLLAATVAAPPVFSLVRRWLPRRWLPRRWLSRRRTVGS